MQSTADAKLFETLFNHASIGIVVVNELAEIILCNNFSLSQFGYNGMNELTGKKIEILIPGRFHHQHEGHRDKYLSHPKNRPMGIGLDLYAVKKDGSEFPVEISLGKYEVDGKNFVAAFIIDITLRKKAEEAITLLNAELEKKVEERTNTLQKIVGQLNDQIKETEEKDIELREALDKEKELGELKSRFVSVASHEFRTPLSTVLSSTYLLQKYTSSEDQHKREKHILRIISSVNLLTEILNDFLSVGKIEEGKILARFSTFDLEKNITQSIAEMQTLSKTGQQIIYQHTGIRDVELDPVMIKHITLNLLSNAIKFSPEHASIHISTVVDDKTIEMKVKDKGIGISKEDQEHLFERFFRARNAMNIQGTGLGLHIVSKYAELMNGTISCNSVMEEGTEFTVVFKTKDY